MDSAWLEAIIVKNNKENIVKVLDVEYESPVPKAQNYLSDIIRVNFNVLIESGKRIKKTIIVKVLNLNLSSRAPTLFRKEIKMYKEVLEQMLELCNEFKDRSEKLWPSMLDYKPYNLIVLEDLTVQNYSVISRNECLDLKHIELVLKGIAKTHAMSRILLDRSLIVVGDDFQLIYATEDSPGVRNFLEGRLNELAESMMSSWPIKWKCIGEQISEERYVVFAKLKELYKTRPNSFHVINHGDAWLGNMMFKYSDNNEPVEVKFIDFQMSHLNSYMWDIIYFTYTSIKASIRKEMFDHLLTIYQESLETSLKLFGYEGRIPSIEDVKLEAKRLEYFAFVVLAVCFPVIIARKNDKSLNENPHSPDGQRKVRLNPEVWRSEMFMRDTVEDFERFAVNGIFG